MYPCRAEALARATRRFDTGTSSFFLYAIDGTISLESEGFAVRGGAGTFAALPGPFELEAQGTCVLIERLGFRAVPTAGRIEACGRLAYIDGCSDTVLVAPPRLGDPVFNHLHFPAGTKQSLHRHPSVRLGVVARGSGVAFGHGPEGPWEIRLETGTFFLLHAHETHAFSTSREAMDVVAFHPDSDWGPTDGAHPMLNRTYLSSR
jgi:hypothetical protein